MAEFQQELRSRRAAIPPVLREDGDLGPGILGETLRFEAVAPLTSLLLVW